MENRKEEAENFSPVHVCHTLQAGSDSDLT